MPSSIHPDQAAQKPTICWRLSGVRTVAGPATTVPDITRSRKGRTILVRVPRLGKHRHGGTRRMWRPGRRVTAIVVRQLVMNSA